MAVTLTSQRFGDTTIITATSSLSGTVYFHWYLDGSWVGMTVSGTRSFAMEPGDQMRVEVIDTNNAAFDGLANAPAGWPARRTLYWVRSTDADVAHYRVEQQREADAWTVLARVLQDATTWSFRILSPRLNDLTNYTWRIIPVDLAGNDGTAITVGPEKIVRTPDGPNFTATWSVSTQRVTFAAAA